MADITSVESFLAEIGKIVSAKPYLSQLRLWFRGQAESRWKLQPAVYRPTFPLKTEGEVLQKERELFQHWRVQSAGILEGDKNDAQLYFLQQHYRVPTRLLDWTSDPLAALFFAVTEERHVTKDGALFVLDAYSLEKQDRAIPVKFRGVATSHHPEFRKVVSRICQWDGKVDFPKFILPVRPDQFDRRLLLQRSCFTCHVPSAPALDKTDLTQKDVDLFKFNIPASAKPVIEKQLRLLATDEYGIFGDLENLALTLKKVLNLP
jgi:hypothetical protein